MVAYCCCDNVEEKGPSQKDDSIEMRHVQPLEGMSFYQVST
jgi:hypothetical protein